VKGKTKFHLTKLIRGTLAVVLLFLLIIILWYFITHWRREAAVPLEKKEIAQQKIERTEGIQYSEFKGEMGRIQVKAQKHYVGEDGNYYLEGKVEIIDFGKKAGQDVFIFADKVVYDKDWNHFDLVGQGRVRYKDIAIESNFLEYEKEEEIFQSSKGVSFSSKRLKGSSQKIIYFLREEKLRLQENVELEMSSLEQASHPLIAKGNSFDYSRKEKKGTMEGDVHLFLGKSRGSADLMNFELSENEEQIRLLFLKGGVKAYLFEEEKKKSPSEGQSPYFLQSEERQVEAEEIKVGTFLDLPRIRAIEAKGNCSLKLVSSSGRVTWIQAGAMDWIFNRKRALREFKAFDNARMVEKDANDGKERLIEGEELTLEGSRSVLWVRGKDKVASRIASETSEVTAKEIAILLKHDDLEAYGEVKVTFRSEKGEKESIGFFSREEPVFAAAKEMRYWKDKKRFILKDNIRIWQGKEMLLAQEVVILEETQEIFGWGTVRSIFFHKPKVGEIEEKLEISAEEMSFQPKDDLISYKEKSSLSSKNISLKAQSISVYLEEGKGKIKEISAKGNVIITQGLQEAQGEEAQYDVDKEIIVLLGNPVLVDKNKGRIEGDKLTFYMGDGRIVVENKDRERSIIVIKS